MKRINIANTFAIAAVTALALGTAPAAKADNNGCSNATLQGGYAHTATGFVTAPPAIAGPVAYVGTLTFDGKGGTTATNFASLNGTIVPVTEKGTYTVNPDCTGTFTTETSLGTTGHGFFVIANNGNEIQGIATDPGTVGTVIARKQFPTVGGWRN